MYLPFQFLVAVWLSSSQWDMRNHNASHFQTKPMRSSMLFSSHDKHRNVHGDIGSHLLKVHKNTRLLVTMSLKYYMEKNWPNQILIFFLSAKHKLLGLFIWAASNTLTNMWLYLKKIHHHIIIFFFHTYHSISVVIGTFLEYIKSI